MSDLRAMLGDRYKAVIQAALLTDKPGLIEDAKRIGGELGQLMYLANVDRMHRTLTAVLPGLLAQAWDQGLRAGQRYQEPCLLHDTAGEDVPGWEMAECTCKDLTNPYRETPTDRRLNNE